MIRHSARARRALALCLAATAPGAAHAQVPPPSLIAPPPVPALPMIADPQPDHPAYGDLLDAIQSSVSTDQVIDTTLAAARPVFVANPEFAAAEAASPGLIDEVLLAIRPVVVQQNERVKVLYRPQFLALFASRLTPEEAAGIAAFYRSELGRKLMTGTIANLSIDARAGDIGTAGKVGAEAVGRDLNASARAGAEQLSPAEQSELVRQSLSNPGLPKLIAMQPEVVALRARLENEPPTAEETAALEAAVSGVFARRLPDG